MMATAQKIDIDAIARKAQRDAKVGNVDLLKAGIPLQMTYWNIVAEPKEPKTTSDGGIELASSVAERQAIQITVARVLACGPGAFAGQTSSGIPLSEMAEGVKCAADLIGKYVIHQKYTGLLLTTRQHQRKLLILTNTEILAITDDPDYWEFYL